MSIKNKKVIAVVGMAGAGKSTAVKYLQKKYACPSVYFGEATFDRMKKEGLSLNYKNERLVREKIRSELGMGAYAKLAIPKINKLLKDNKIVLAESLYSWEEYLILKKKYKKNFKVIAVLADAEIRFLRLKKRKEERPIKSHQEFEERDWSEIEKLHKGGPIAIADFNVLNNGSKLSLQKRLREIFKEI